LNSKKKGNIGIAEAILYFTRLGYVVALPLTDSQSYDLIIDDGVGLKRIQAKFSSYTGIELRTISNVRGKKLDIRKFDKIKSDFVFIVCQEKLYLISSELLDGKGRINIANYENCIVGRQTGQVSSTGC
jgi:hypothetical protein